MLFFAYVRSLSEYNQRSETGTLFSSVHVEGYQTFNLQCGFCGTLSREDPMGN
jgi:hypothetical protein